MGCDIHGPFIEVCEFPGQLDPWITRCEFTTWRDYALFGALAGVRSMDIDPPTEPKGMPADASHEWWEHVDEDCHHHSWLTLAELRAAGAAYEARYAPSQDITLWATIMEFVERTEAKSTRVGFCFDN